MDQGPPDLADRLDAFSTWLARERELRGLSADAVARATRLAPAVIEALESGEPARMPSRAYVIGYLRTYAGAVGLDPDDVVLRYEEAAGEERERGHPSQAKSSRVAWWLAVALAFALAGVAAWAWWR